MRSTYGLALSTLLVLSGCGSLTLGLGPTIVGSGVTKEATREVAPFTGIEVASSLEATVTIGPKSSVVLSVDDNILPLVETTVKDGRLLVRYVSGANISTKLPQKVVIVVPSLDYLASSGASKLTVSVVESKTIKIEASGASTIELSGLSSDLVAVEVSGASRVNLAGKAKQLTGDVSGAAKLLASDVPFESAKIDISGASQGEVQVTGSIEGDVDGASTLTVRGNPTTRAVKTSGASTVTY